MPEPPLATPLRSMRWRGCPSQSPSACGHGPCPEATKTRRWRRPHQSCLHLQGGTSEDLSARSRVRPLGFDPATASQVSPGAGEMHRRRGDDDGASYARRRWFVPSPPERASRGCSLHIGSGSRRLGFVAGPSARGATGRTSGLVDQARPSSRNWRTSWFGEGSSHGGVKRHGAASHCLPCPLARAPAPLK